MIDWTSGDVWTVLVGVLLPGLIAVVNQTHWSPKTRAVMALAVCWVVSLVVTWARGPVNWHDWRNTFAAVTVLALAAFHLWWRPSTIAATIEDRTTVGLRTPRRR